VIQGATVLAAALDSPAVTVILVIVFAAAIVIALTAVASALLWLVLWTIDRYGGVR
jgi:hypothetical protein